MRGLVILMDFGLRMTVNPEPQFEANWNVAPYQQSLHIEYRLEVRPLGGEWRQVYQGTDRTWGTTYELIGASVKDSLCARLHAVGTGHTQEQLNLYPPRTVCVSGTGPRESDGEPVDPKDDPQQPTKPSIPTGISITH